MDESVGYSLGRQNARWVAVALALETLVGGCVPLLAAPEDGGADAPAEGGGDAAVLAARADGADDRTVEPEVGDAGGDAREDATLDADAPGDATADGSDASGAGDGAEGDAAVGTDVVGRDQEGGATAAGDAAAAQDASQIDGAADASAADMDAATEAGIVDAAAVWLPVPSNDAAIVTTIAVEAPAQNPTPCAVGFSDGEIFFAVDGTDPIPAWTDLRGASSPLPGSAVTTIALGQEHVYAAFAGSIMGPHVFRYDFADGGAWHWLSNEPVDEVWGLSVSPVGPLVYAVGDPLGAVATSTDLGETWSTTPPVGDTLAVSLSSGDQVTAVATVGFDPQTLLVGSRNGRVYTVDTRSGGGVKDVTQTLMPAAAVTRVTTSIGSPALYYVTFAVQGQFSVWGTDGSQWSNLTTSSLPTTSQGADYGMFGVSVEPVAPPFLYVNGSFGAGASGDQGKTWTWRSTL